MTKERHCNLSQMGTLWLLTFLISLFIEVICTKAPSKEIQNKGITVSVNVILATSEQMYVGHINIRLLFTP